ncbi:signal peptide peptidase SppA [Sphingomonas sp.]|uniref:signal peptide peptidase SppA n=1 Tax=Sphingomonas sp. TaxID=28214 RepID=UPI001AFE4139|nr:signal peptide peptidase SppA [Sphingomonas sp.]MBO9714409.1 signal peptide peptidase SppA [Sphingomonas sp.]
MKLVKGAWKVLVAIKDGLVLVFMLLFFILLFTVLSSRPNPRAVHPGALVVALDGTLAEQPEEPDPLAGLNGGEAVKQTGVRDVVRALDAAIKDDDVKAVVLDLDRFGGGLPASVSEVANAVGRVRASGKKVLAYATAYTDSGYAIAANASEVWMHPLGGTLFMGPGGSRLYYKGLIDKLGVNVHVYKVGKYKSYVEPYVRSDMSPEAREANQALSGAVLNEWQAGIAKARPQAKVAEMLAQPDAIVTAAHGDLAAANKAAGLIDRTGDRLAFGKRVAELAGKKDDKAEGNFRAIKLKDYLAAHPASTAGDEIGVLTVAGDIVDGKAGPGTAGGDSVSQLLLEGLKKHKFKALVVRVDSPGGSVLASEQIRQAILQAKAQKLPVVISMAGLAASGGYWISTAGDFIYADRATITGSIGIFGMVPTFEKTLAKIGVTSDGVTTTPISGQPDVYGGTNAATDTIFQAVIDQGYRNFITRVAEARKMTLARVDEIGQGRVWIGVTAQQLGLVDKFGGIDDAVAEAARRAGLDPAKVHPVYLAKAPDAWKSFLNDVLGGGDDDGSDWTDEPGGDDAFAKLAGARQAIAAQAIGDVRRLASVQGAQARCLECGGLAPVVVRRSDLSLLELVLAKFGG